MRTIPLVFIGSGRVGTALRGHLETYNDKNRTLKFEVAAVVRSDRIELADGTCRARPSSDMWESVIETAHELRRKRPETVIVDVSDAKTRSTHLSLVESGFTVVTANKRPLSVSHEHFRRLTEALDGRGHHAYWFEATVGAGLPVIRLIRELVQTGDRVTRITAILSGTLNFLCDAHERRVPFGQALSEARDLGLTEPDPREDLLCSDVIRKASILASLCGCWWLPSDAITPVISPDLARLLGTDFVEKAKSIEPWPEQWPSLGTPVEYVVRIEPSLTGSSRIEGGLVKRDGAYPKLEGPENRFVIETERNGSVPIVIRGPGAGAAVTATAVFGDLLRSLARL